MIILSIIAFSLVGRQEPIVMIVSRILLIPVIAAVGYEILRFGARHRANPIVKVIIYPGLLVQMITTKQPTRRHDRGRDRVDGAGARGGRRDGPGGLRRLRATAAGARPAQAAAAGATPASSLPGTPPTGAAVTGTAPSTVPTAGIPVDPTGSSLPSDPPPGS